MKHEKYPILEFDPDKDALIGPEYVQSKYPPLPKNLIIVFFHEVIDELLKRGDITHHVTIKGENNLELYVFNDSDVALMPGALGGPACGGFMDEAIAMGARRILFAGGGGVLDKEHTVGKLVVIDSAIRDEGLSYHYLPPSREVRANPEVISKITKHLSKIGADYVVGKAWTTDAFFRETRTRIQRRRNEGALIVEMEQASLLAVSTFRNVEYGAIVYCGDDVSGDTHDPRSWRTEEDIRHNIVKALKAVLEDWDTL